MVIDDDNIISCRKRKDKRDYKVKSESKSKVVDKGKREIGNVVYINVRVTHKIITSIKTNKKYSIKRDISVYDKR